MKKSLIKWGIGTGVMAAAFVLLDALFLEKYFFRIKTFDIGTKYSNKKLRLLLLSDLHFKQQLWPFYRKLARKINELQPDIILIAGDVVDQHGNKKPVNQFFNLLNEQIPKIVILGNHEHKSEVSIQSIKRIYQQHHCDLLVNESKVYKIKGSSLTVTGLDDFIEGSANIEKAVKNVGREAHHILLIHSPLQQEKVMDKLKSINAVRREDQQLNIQYIFAGHNHGGQVRIFGLAPVLPEKSGNYVHGWYNNHSPYLYVSQGFGTSAIPVRFGARSEIILFNYYV